MKNKTSLLKDILAFFLLLILAVILLLIIVFNTQKKLYLLEEELLHTSIIKSNSIRIASSLNKTLTHIEYIGHKISIANDPTIEFIHMLFKRKIAIDVSLDNSIFRELDDYMWVDNRFNVRVSSIEGKVKEYHVDLDLYPVVQAKKRTWNLHFGHVLINGNGQSNISIPISYGITDQRNHYIGSIVSNIYINDILELLKEEVQNKNYNLFLSDIEGNIIFGSDNLILNRGLKPFIKGNKGSFQEGQRNFIYEKIKGFPFKIIMSQEKGRFYDLNKKNNLLMIFLSLSLVILATLLMIIMYKRLLIPIKQISDYAKDITEGSKKTIQNISNNNLEIIELKNSLDSLIVINNKLSSINKLLKTKEKSLLEINNKIKQSLKEKDTLYSMQMNYEKKESVCLIEIIESAITILYPEISSKNLNIIFDKKNKTEVTSIKALLLKYFIGTLFKSVFFSRANSIIKINLLQRKEYVQLKINDFGLGSVKWRNETIKKIRSIYMQQENHDIYREILNIDLKEIEKKDGVAQDLKIVNKDKNNKGNIINIIKFKTEQ